MESPRITLVSMGLALSPMTNMGSSFHVINIVYLSLFSFSANSLILESFERVPFSSVGIFSNFLIDFKGSKLFNLRFNVLSLNSSEKKSSSFTLSDTFPCLMSVGILNKEKR